MMKTSFNVATHPGRQHTDELLACSILSCVFEPIRIVRTDDPEQLKLADAVVDVGGTYDPDNLRFDHHGEGTAPRPPKGRPPYSSAGLVWKHFGRHVVRSRIDETLEGKITRIPGSESVEDVIAKVADRIDRELMAPVDAWDNGIRPNLSATVLPVQWLVRFLDFSDAVLALTQALLDRIDVLLNQWECYCDLGDDLMEGRSSEFYVFPKGVLIVTTGEYRIDMMTAAKAVKDLTSLNLFGVIHPQNGRHTWALTVKEPQTIRHPKIIGRRDRRSFYSKDREILFQVARLTAGFILAQK